MRILLAILLVSFLLFAVPLYGADVRLAWDAPANPDDYGTAVRVYEVVGSNYVLKGEVASSVTTFVLVGVTPGKHTYIARSYSDVWKIESADSNQAVTPNLNKPVSGLVWTIVVP